MLRETRLLRRCFTLPQCTHTGLIGVANGWRTRMSKAAPCVVTRQLGLTCALTVTWRAIMGP